MPTKRKTSSRKVTTRSPRSSKEVPLNEIAIEAQRLAGWDPRITDYFLADDPKLKAITGKENKMFTVQHAEQTKEVISNGFLLRELGALADETTRVNRRIVKLTRIQEPVVG